MQTQEYVFIKRVVDAAPPVEDEIRVYAELEMRAGDTVARLAARACKEFQRWAVDADQLLLYLVPHTGKENPTKTEEEDAALLDKPAYSLEEARVANGAWLLARVPTRAAAAAPAGALRRARAGSPAPLAPVCTALAISAVNALVCPSPFCLRAGGAGAAVGAGGLGIVDALDALKLELK